MSTGPGPESERALGDNSHTFAAGISYISILTGTFQLFYFGVEFAGPGYWWSWPMVFLGQLMVALCFCELAARCPVTGSVHNWARTLGGPHIGWLGGWMMVTATMVSLSAVALAYQITLPQISEFFQFVGTGTGRTDAAANAVLLGSVLIVLTTLVNVFGVRLMARINSAGSLVELIAALTLIALLASHLTHGPEVINRAAGYGVGESLGHVCAFLTAALASAYVMYGFGTASSSPGGESPGENSPREKSLSEGSPRENSLGEESPREKSLGPGGDAPRALLRALVVCLLIGGLILLFALLAVPDLNAARLSVDGLQFVVLSTLGPTVGATVLWCVVIAITVCALAVQAAGIRLVLAMARDNSLPAAPLLARAGPRSGTAVVPAIVTGLVAVGVLVINVNQPRIFSVISGVAVVMIYLACLTVTLPMLVRRLRGTWQPTSEGRFSLGRFGLPVNLLAVLWGIGMSVNLAWPRSEVHGAEPPFPWYPRWGVLLFAAVVAAGGFTYYWLVQRERTGAVEAHRSGAADPPSTAPTAT
ncbi:APC family permease [Streptomyces sp. NPDC056909]|uniref:APC family permease n=1 Tax=Streptomyces sp. NPDC056909 TaxID=3345963 RepID=UPI0036C2E861